MLAIYTFRIKSILASGFQLCLQHHLEYTVPHQSQCLSERYMLEYRAESGFATPTFEYKGYLNVALLSSFKSWRLLEEKEHFCCVKMSRLKKIVSHLT